VEADITFMASAPPRANTYNAVVRLLRSTVMVDGCPPIWDMAAIRTGSRRIISYLVSPLQTFVAQVAHER
jgi:hemolysin D